MGAGGLPDIRSDNNCPLFVDSALASQEWQSERTESKDCRLGSRIFPLDCGLVLATLIAATHNAVQKHRGPSLRQRIAVSFYKMGQIIVVVLIVALISLSGPKRLAQGFAEGIRAFFDHLQG
jgi:hypothetical protein